jgi:hypothetical protein
VSIPEDLVVPTDCSQQDKDAFLAAQRIYGIRELVLHDRDMQWATGIGKVKRVGLAKLKEFTRMAFTGEIKFVYLGNLGNAAIGLLNKDRAVSITGVPAADGLPTNNPGGPQSQRFNSIWYIEKCVHRYTKNAGYRVSLSVSSRKPERIKSLSNLTVTTLGIPVKAVQAAGDNEYDDAEPSLRD